MQKQKHFIHVLHCYGVQWEVNRALCPAVAAADQSLNFKIMSIQETQTALTRLHRASQARLRRSEAALRGR
jgi:hypothetical protein